MIDPQLIIGDCVEILATMDAQSVDAIVTDPPYAISVMGHDWDHMRPGEFEAWCKSWARECLRVLKPGGYMVAFGAARTWHRLACGIEDAGFVIRDGIAWLYTQGYPPSLDVSEAVEAFQENGPSGELGPSADVLTVTTWLREARDAAGWTNRRIDELFGTNGMAGHWCSTGTQPAVPRIEQWDRLRDAMRFDDTQIRPLVIKLAATRTWTASDSQDRDQRGWFNGLGDAPATGEGQKWGTRLKPAFEPTVLAQKPPSGTITANIHAYGTGGLHLESDGRFPANVAIAEGLTVTGIDDPTEFWPAFRYTPKAPAWERPKVGGITHPTVKPLALIQWLVDLVTPPGGVVLDPFAGSGTTGVAALAEGRRTILIEKEQKYARIIHARLNEPIQPTLG